MGCDERSKTHRAILLRRSGEPGCTLTCQEGSLKAGNRGNRYVGRVWGSKGVMGNMGIYIYLCKQENIGFGAVAFCSV